MRTYRNGSIRFVEDMLIQILAGGVIIFLVPWIIVDLAIARFKATETVYDWVKKETCR